MTLTELRAERARLVLLNSVKGELDERIKEIDREIALPRYAVERIEELWPEWKRNEKPTSDVAKK